MVEQLTPWKEQAAKGDCVLQFAKHSLSRQLLVPAPKLRKPVKSMISVPVAESLSVLLSPSFLSALCTLLTQVCNEVSAS